MFERALKNTEHQRQNPGLSARIPATDGLKILLWNKPSIQINMNMCIWINFWKHKTSKGPELDL